MKIIAISDTHGYFYPVDKLPEVDLLVHAGDATMRGTTDELDEFISWLEEVKIRIPHVIYVPGNHDRCFNKALREVEARSKMQSIATVLTDGFHQIDKVLFYGSSFTPPVGSDWAYYGNEDQRNAYWERRATARRPDVLITHGPAYRVADKVSNDRHIWPHVGCKHLRQYLEIQNPALHIFGHIHEQYGIYQAGQFLLEDLEEQPLSTTFVNASLNTDAYRPDNKPIVIELNTDQERVSVKSTSYLK
jgi:Icc-related predicted phosphoesterase